MTTTATGSAKHEVMALLDDHPFRAPWWLRGRHRQTIFSPLFRRPTPPAWQRETWDTPDDDELDVHIVHQNDTAPTVLLLHGLEGNVRSHYMAGLGRRFHRRGWNVVGMEQRSCGHRMNKARRLYHSGVTSDLQFVVDRILARWPRTLLCVAGVSLGGNITAKWLGETGADLPERVVAAAAVSPPFDLTVSGRVIDQALGGWYTRLFLRSLIPKAEAKERQFPGCVDIEAIRRCRTFADFDTLGTAALHGFRDAQDYWEKVSCGQFLPGVRRPLLLVAAEDDPFNPGSTHPREVAATSPWIHGLFTRRGGHVGFVHQHSPLAIGYWAEEQIERFFDAYLRRAGAHAQ